MLFEVPVIETQRMKLRGHTASDFAALAAMWKDPEVTRFIGGVPSTESRTWGRLLTYVGHWALMGFGYWAVEDKATGEFIGEIGFADFKRDVQPSIAGIPEVGWAFVSQSHGKGFATEALSAVVAWSDRHFSDKRTVCIIDPGNLASLRVAEKCGYRKYADTAYNGSLNMIFERPRA